MNTPIYTFWLLDCGRSPISPLRFYPLFIRCTVGSENLELHLPEQVVSIPLKQIELVERYQFHHSRYAPTGINVRLKLSESTLPNRTYDAAELYLVPMNVLSKIPQRSIEDLVVLIAVIQSLLKGQNPNVHSNPYYRELQLQNRIDEFSEEKWTASVSPEMFTKFDSEGLINKNILIAVPIAVLSVLLIAAILYNVVLPLFQGK